MLCCCLVFEQRPGQYQLMLDFPVSEPLSSAVLQSVRVPSDGFGVDCAWFVVCSHLRMDVSSHQHVCFWSSEHTCSTCSSPRLVRRRCVTLSHMQTAHSNAHVTDLACSRERWDLKCLHCALNCFDSSHRPVEQPTDDHHPMCGSTKNIYFCKRTKHTLLSPLGQESYWTSTPRYGACTLVVRLGQDDFLQLVWPSVSCMLLSFRCPPTVSLQCSKKQERLIPAALAADRQHTANVLQLIDT